MQLLRDQPILWEKHSHQSFGKTGSASQRTTKGKKNPQIHLIFICQTNLRKFFERITKKIDDKKIMKAISLYFTQAYDKLSDQKLVGKR